MNGPIGKLRKIVGLRFGLPYVRRADLSRDRGDWIEAMVDYRRGLDWMPWREDLKVQIGNCLKEFGDYDGAVRVYSSVTVAPSRMEAQKQIGDVNRRAGGVILPYDVASAADKETTDGEHTQLYLSERLFPNRVKLERAGGRKWLGTLGRTDNVSARIRGNQYAAVKLDQVGSFSLERDGLKEPVLAGVVAIRGRILSLSRIEAAEIMLGEGLDARPVAQVDLKLVQVGAAALKLQVFNAWIDCAHLPAGRHWFSVRVGRKIPPVGLFVNIIVNPAGDEDFAASNAYVPSVLGDSPSPDQDVIARPAIARTAARSIFDHPIRSILVMRADQLGDVSASLPAMKRLRELFPDASISALVQDPVRDIVLASGVVDEVVTVRLDYDPKTERRHLSVSEEERLQSSMGQYDLAIDLCPGDETRPILLLTGARYLVGFNPDRFTFLDFGLGVRSRDKVNQQEKLSHAAFVMSLVETMGLAALPARYTVPRASGENHVLARHGLTAKGYVVLHTGARHTINQWPLDKFVGLAERLLSETSCSVVMFMDAGADFPVELEPFRERVRVLGIVDPASLDEIMSGARLMVGNDSGPKHLAAVRGVPTVSLHVDRLNWNEWGQDAMGVVLSKRIPCTGCGLNDVQLCGRDAVCVRSIGIDEVMAAARAYL